MPGGKVSFPEIEVLLCNVKSVTDSILDREEEERERQGTVSGFPQALEIMENLENQEKKFHAWKNHGICKNLNNHGKIMEFCEII